MTRQTPLKSGILVPGKRGARYAAGTAGAGELSAIAAAGVTGGLAQDARASVKAIAETVVFTMSS